MTPSQEEIDAKREKLATCEAGLAACRSALAKAPEHKKAGYLDAIGFEEEDLAELHKWFGEHGVPIKADPYAARRNAEERKAKAEAAEAEKKKADLLNANAEAEEKRKMADFLRAQAETLLAKAKEIEASLAPAQSEDVTARQTSGSLVAPTEIPGYTPPGNTISK